MATQTPRFNLDKYSQGEDNWSHSDTVDLLDELAVETDTIANRDASGNYDDELFYATDQKLLYRWDSGQSDWLIEGGVGNSSDRIPNLWADSINTNTLEADGATIGNLPAGRALSQSTINDITVHTGDQVSVSAQTFETIFDVATPVTVVAGFVNGFAPVDLRATWEDGTTDTIYPRVLARDQNGNIYGSIIVPSIEDVTKLEFKNDAGSGSNPYGYNVVTR